MSDETCGNCGAGTENEPLVLCDECNTDPSIALRAENTALKARLEEMEGFNRSLLLGRENESRPEKAEARVAKLEADLAMAHDAIDKIRKIPGVSMLIARAMVEALR